VTALSPKDYQPFDPIIFTFDGDYMECYFTIFYDLEPVNLKIFIEK